MKYNVAHLKTKIIIQSTIQEEEKSLARLIKTNSCTF